MESKAIILTPSQSLIAKDNHRFRVISSGRRFGKSTLVALEMFAIGVSNDNARIPYYAPTRDDARDIMWGMLKKVCEPLIIDTNEGRLEIIIKNKFGGQSQLLLYGWEAVQERGKGVGVKNNHIFLDEVAKYKNFWRGWEEILRPTLTDLVGGATFISTPNGFNHFYDLYGMEAKDTDYKSFHFTSYDNPHLPFEELEKAKMELTEDRFAQEYLADFRKTEGLVYKEFNRDRHVYTDAVINTVDVLAGIDWGWTNPASVHRIRKDSDRHYWIDNEFYKTQQTTSQIIEYAKSLAPNKVYPDPAEPDRNEEARRAGLNVREVTKDVAARISCVQELFKQNRLHIHSSCVNFIWELETYSYPERKADHNENEVPTKENDHACFIADTLIETKRGFLHIDKVTTNDFVWTPFGFSKVIESKKTGVKDVFDYGVFICTNNHPVISTQGIAPIDELSYNSFICGQTQKQFTLMEYLIAGILTQRKEVKDFILGGLLIRNSEVKQDTYIEMFGNISTEKSLKDILFIIKTATITTILPILNLLLKKSMLNGIIGEIQKDSMNILRELDILQKNGMLLKQVENGTESIRNIIGKLGLHLLKSVLNAVETTVLSSLKEVNSVIENAKPKHLGKKEVYNLTTEDGMYFANGTLVSNCDEVGMVLYMQEAKGSGKAHVHYAGSAQPMYITQTKRAHTYIPKL